MLIAVYVDDLITLSNNSTEMEMFKIKLNEKFDMKDLGEIHHYLELQIIYDREKQMISISQVRYIEEILKYFNMSDCKLIEMPMDLGTRLLKETALKPHKEIENMKEIPYQSAVGSLMYIMLGTRPDITYAVRAMSYFNSNYGQEHWTAVK